ncbi:MAG: hypothetical protein K9J13_11875 [Saprospiraceae bacterium]|nr:hypothetical protein [Saprospiraceae bacterium]
MKNHTKLSFLLLLMVIVIFGCKTDKNRNCSGHWDTRMKFVNNSSNDIIVVHSSDYPDTISTNLENHTKKRLKGIDANSTEIKYELCDWESYFEDIKSGILMVFVIRDDGQQIDEILENHVLLKRYDFTYQELQNLNWIITYP